MLALSLKLTLCGHCENPSDSPHTLLTVSGITFIIVTASVGYPERLYEVTEVNSVGSNDDWEQAQLDMMPRPPIDRVVPTPGLLTIILLLILSQGTS